MSHPSNHTLRPSPHSRDCPLTVCLLAHLLTAHEEPKEAVGLVANQNRPRGIAHSFLLRAIRGSKQKRQESEQGSRLSPRSDTCSGACGRTHARSHRSVSKRSSLSENLRCRTLRARGIYIKKEQYKEKKLTTLVTNANRSQKA